MRGSLVPIEPRVVSVGGRLSPTALELPDGLRFNAWESVLKALLQLEDSVVWWVADAAAYGERWYRKDYGPALDRYERETLWNLSRVARAVETSRRREDLSFSHHVEVGSLDPDMQTAFLADAFEENWSHKELRARVQEFKRRELGEQPAAPPSWTWRAPADLYEICVSDADRAGVEPVEWLQRGILWLHEHGSPHLALEVAGAA